jgi:hypothetical protein
MTQNRPTFTALREAYDYNMKYAEEQMRIVASRGDTDHMRQYNAIRAMAEYNAAAAIADAVLYMLRDEAPSVTVPRLASPGYKLWKSLYEAANNKAARIESTISTAMLLADVHNKLCLNAEPPLHYTTEPYTTAS